jgi:hypothetical protein
MRSIWLPALLHIKVQGQKKYYILSGSILDVWAKFKEVSGPLSEIQVSWVFVFIFSLINKKKIIVQKRHWISWKRRMQEPRKIWSITCSRIFVFGFYHLIGKMSVVQKLYSQNFVKEATKVYFTTNLKYLIFSWSTWAPHHQSHYVGNFSWLSCKDFRSGDWFPLGSWVCSSKPVLKSGVTFFVSEWTKFEVSLVLD